ncbi:TetR/AcrR family transcriptional repressor of mexJK operon [Catenulispora sp. EB89]|uniref:TetR/AcrR family transcriptional regulator n=1 Tax=Catenulispora sp. EB89 TaxID=3156257 RepID=UPI0035115264
MAEGRQLRGAALKERILEAARVTFLREGFDASMDEVAAAAGTTKVSVYGHFGTKEALLAAVVHDQLGRALAEPMRLVVERLADSADVRGDLTEACRAWVAGIASPDMLSLRNLVVGEQRRFPQLGEVWRERGPARFHAVIADALRRQVDARRLSIADVDLAVLQLSGLVVSPNLIYGAYGDPVDPDTRERLIVAGVDMFVNEYRYRANA